MKITRPVLWICFCVVALILAVMFYLRDKPIDRDLIGNQLCAPPCWMGITPGSASKDQAIAILRKAEETGEGTLKILPNNTFIFWYSKERKNYSLRLQNDEIQNISLSSIENTNLGMLVDHLGEPDGWTIKRNEFSTFIIYPERGVLAVVAPKVSANQEEYSLTYSIFRNLCVGPVYFVKPGTRNQMLAFIFGDSFNAETFFEFFNSTFAAP